MSVSLLVLRYDSGCLAQACRRDFAEELAVATWAGNAPLHPCCHGNGDRLAASPTVTPLIQ